MASSSASSAPPRAEPNPWFDAWLRAAQSSVAGLGALGMGVMPGPASGVAGASGASGVASTAWDALRERYLADHAQLMTTLAGGGVPALDDRRFKDPAWRETPGYAALAALYLLNARYLHALAETFETDAKTRRRVRFAVEQWLAASAPSNFLATNPAAQRRLIESGGETLKRGIENLVQDLAQGRIRQSDDTRFEVGGNLAVTEGAVVHETELLQLIQYRPRTARVFELPLLIVPPCINKYYVLDLRPENSFVRYALDQGFQVFMVSWRNPSADLAARGWDDYVEALLDAVAVTRRISGAAQLGTLGFCIGGTLLATAAAVLAARGERSLASMTLLTAMLDFSDTGVLDVFIDEAQVRLQERAIGGQGRAAGLMSGKEFGTTFSMLRPNELLWNYVVDNYLLGGTPPPFDLLYWNADCTNLPGPMFCWYLRHTYLSNRLRVPGALEVCGVPIDFGAIEAPSFVYASREDHIVPWNTAFASTRLLGGETRFVLGAAGHIAGVINPPAQRRRSYWTHDASGLEAEDWLGRAQEQAGSWWGEWAQWLGLRSGKPVKARGKLGGRGFPPIEAAPGRYVKERA